MAILDYGLENALGVIDSLKKENVVFYGFNVVNNSSVLAQTGDGYRTMQVVDSAIDSSVTTLPAGDLIYREANKMSFVIPSFYRAVFMVAQLNLESGNANVYNRVILEYGAGQTREIARAAQTSVDRRCQQILVASYGGITPYGEATKTVKLSIDTYGSQQYFGANVVIACIA